MLNAAGLRGDVGFRHVEVAGDLDMLFLETRETET